MCICACVHLGVGGGGGGLESAFLPLESQLPLLKVSSTTTSYWSINAYNLG